MYEVLILAPHVDDETIGCWSVLNNPSASVTVAYFNEVTEVRKAEAVAASDRLWFNVKFDVTDLDFSRYDEVYVPSRRDWHTDHKVLNAAYRKHATHFYSADMGHGRFLGEEQSRSKRQFLNECYPSQRELWDANAKYYLFEDIQTCDYDSQMILYIKTGDFTYEVTVDVASDLGQLSYLNRSTELTVHQMMNKVLTVVPYGKVVVKDTGSNLILEAQA